MWIGRYTVGQSIPLGLTSTDPSGTPTLPDSAPVAEIYDNATIQVGSDISLPIVDPYALDTFGATNCLFGREYRLHSSFSPGRYQIIYKWVLSGVTYKRCAEFDVMYATTHHGQTIGLFGVPRSTGLLVHFDLESGRIQMGRNPH